MLSLSVALGNMDTVMMLILPTHKHGICFHLICILLNCFFQYTRLVLRKLEEKFSKTLFFREMMNIFHIKSGKIKFLITWFSNDTTP